MESVTYRRCPSPRSKQPRRSVFEAVKSPMNRHRRSSLRKGTTAEQLTDPFQQRDDCWSFAAGNQRSSYDADTRGGAVRNRNEMALQSRSSTSSSVAEVAYLRSSTLNDDERKALLTLTQQHGRRNDSPWNSAEMVKRSRRRSSYNDAELIAGRTGDEFKREEQPKKILPRSMSSCAAVARAGIVSCFGDTSPSCKRFKQKRVSIVSDKVDTPPPSRAATQSFCVEEERPNPGGRSFLPSAMVQAAASSSNVSTMWLQGLIQSSSNPRRAASDRKASDETRRTASLSTSSSSSYDLPSTSSKQTDQNRLEVATPQQRKPRPPPVSGPPKRRMGFRDITNNRGLLMEVPHPTVECNNNNNNDASSTDLATESVSSSQDRTPSPPTMLLSPTRRLFKTNSAHNFYGRRQALDRQSSDAVEEGVRTKRRTTVLSSSPTHGDENNPPYSAACRVPARRRGSPLTRPILPVRVWGGGCRESLCIHLLEE